MVSVSPYTTGATVLPQSLTTAGSGPIWLDEVDCSGTESQLVDCRARPFGFHDCTHGEDVGIRCMSTSTLKDESNNN